MNTRERFVNVLTGKPVDRVPFMKVFGAANHVLPSWERNHPGLRQEIDTICRFEGAHRGWERPPVNMQLTGLGSRQVLEEDGEKRIVRRSDGQVELFLKGQDYHHQVLEYPVKTRADWERIKAKHLNPDDPSRFPDNWADLVTEYAARDYPLQLTHGGVYGFARRMMGDTNLAYAFYDDPTLVHDIMDTYTEVALEIWERMTCVVDFDLVECWEDMASKNGAIISPDMFREFMAPNYRRIRSYAEAHGVEIVLVDSDGYILDLAELMLEAGVNAMYPFEVLAGNDLFELRNRLPGMAAIGGLAKEAMAAGPDAVRKEVEKARRLIQSGRFIPGPDHFVQSNTSWEQYRFFMQTLRQAVLEETPKHSSNP